MFDENCLTELIPKNCLWAKRERYLYQEGWM